MLGNYVDKYKIKEGFKLIRKGYTLSPTTGYFVFL